MFNHGRAWWPAHFLSPDCSNLIGRNSRLNEIVKKDHWRCGQVSPQLHRNLMTGALGSWVFPFTADDFGMADAGGWSRGAPGTAPKRKKDTMKQTWYSFNSWFQLRITRCVICTFAVRYGLQAMPVAPVPSFKVSFLLSPSRNFWRTTGIELDAKN